MQHIRIARPDEQARTLAALGPPSENTRTLISLDERDHLRAAAHVSASDETVRITALHADETLGDGLYPVLKMALHVALSTHKSVRHLQVDTQTDYPALARIGLQRLDGAWRAPLSGLAASFTEAVDSSVLGLSCERHVVEQGALIFKRGQPAKQLHVVARGSVRIVGVTQSGEPAEVALLSGGEVLGSALLRGQSQHSVHAVAHSAEVDLLVVDREDLWARIERSLPLTRWLLGAQARRIEGLTGRVLDGDGPEIRWRLAQVLRDFTKGGRRCDLDWLAAQVGCRRPRAQTLLSDLWEFVTLQLDGVEVHDPDGLSDWLSENG